MIGNGFTDRTMTETEVREIVAQALAAHDMTGKRVLFITPDSTRSGPLDMMFRVFYDALGDKVAALDYLIALGTHMAMDEAALLKLFGLTATEKTTKYAQVRLFNHEWEKPETFKQIGMISADEIEAITGGLMRMDVPVTINKKLWEYDQVIICGPTFPHEVVGFSGGNKYFFPGVAGPEVINFSHWLGAVITSRKVIGTKVTPVRTVIDKAASFIDVPKLCFSMVVKGHHDLVGLYCGTPEDAYSAAADLSAQHHILYVEKPFRRVLSVMPDLYDDIWTAAKGMYKLEPAIVDGGEVIIYAPHIDEISYTHGKILDEVGYHCRDYFLKQWDKFKDYPWGVLAHSTHLKGAGTYDAEKGIETPRIQVTLATGVPQERCEKVNLGYLDPASINLDEWKGREDEGILLVPRAGEMLYRLASEVVS
ncbi:MAG TPA: lactate racemase domain-containing protein [Anaerolineae bacterium]|nr:lactate racemase domain-containing protein [Anaerolineae bacterium]HQH37521.1 lactate racemase domain-containing protein [Anaerolineae bacterium]